MVARVKARTSDARVSCSSGYCTAGGRRKRDPTANVGLVDQDTIDQKFGLNC